MIWCDLATAFKSRGAASEGAKRRHQAPLSPFAKIALCRRGVLFASLFLLLPMMLDRPALAASSEASEAAVFVQRLVAQAAPLISDPQPFSGAENSAFRRILNAGFDVKAIARFVLDDRWARATEDEQAQFGLLFQDFLLISLQEYLSGISTGNFAVVAARPRGDSGASVRSQVQSEGSLLHIEWRLWWRGGGTGGGWRIVDVIVQGVSLARTYRSQIAAMFDAGGGNMSGLLNVLRRKISQMDPTAAPGLVERAYAAGDGECAGVFCRSSDDR